MRRIFHFVHQSLDGYIEGPNGEFDWPQMGPELSAHAAEITAETDTILYGRVVWDMMSSFWPQAESLSDHPHDVAYAPVWRATPKIVVSRSLRSAEWNTTVINDDVAARLGALKEEPGKDIVLMGGRDLAASLAAEGLLDERRVVVHPVLLGGGRALFDQAGDRMDLTLMETRTFDQRSVLLRYAL